MYANISFAIFIVILIIVNVVVFYNYGNKTSLPLTLPVDLNTSQEPQQTVNQAPPQTTNDTPVVVKNPVVTTPPPATSPTAVAEAQPTVQPTIINDNSLNSAGSPVEATPTATPIKYGDSVRLKNMHQIYGGYATKCGSAGVCGPNITLKPNRENANQKWIVRGRNQGTLLRYGDIISLYCDGSGLYLSPCDKAIERPRCGVGATLRPDAEFIRWEPGSYLRKWKVIGEVGKTVKVGSIVQLKAIADKWPGHDGWLSACGNAGACGIDLTLRADHTNYDLFSFELY